MVVSQSVIDEYELCQEKSLNMFAMIEQDTDGLWFVDSMTAVPNLQLIPQISASLTHKASLHANENDRVRQKNNWIISYFTACCYRFRDRGDYEKYVVAYI